MASPYQHLVQTGAIREAVTVDPQDYDQYCPECGYRTGSWSCNCTAVSVITTYPKGRIHA